MTYATIKSSFFLPFFFFLNPIYYLRITLALPPSSRSDPGSHIGPSFPLPTTVRAFIFIARNIQHFLPSSTRVKLHLPTLLGALSSLLFFCIFASEVKSHHGGNRTQGPSLLIVFGVTTRPPGRPASAIPPLRQKLILSKLKVQPVEQTGSPRCRKQISFEKQERHSYDFGL